MGKCFLVFLRNETYLNFLILISTIVFQRLKLAFRLKIYLFSKRLGKKIRVKLFQKYLENRQIFYLGQKSAYTKALE